VRHRKGFESECQPPWAWGFSWKWKIGQVWVCECGNMFKVIWSYEDKDWEFIGTVVKEGSQ